MTEQREYKSAKTPLDEDSYAMSIKVRYTLAELGAACSRLETSKLDAKSHTMNIRVLADVLRRVCNIVRDIPSIEVKGKKK